MGACLKVKLVRFVKREIIYHIYAWPTLHKTCCILKAIEKSREYLLKTVVLAQNYDDQNVNTVLRINFSSCVRDGIKCVSVEEAYRQHYE